MLLVVGLKITFIIIVEFKMKLEVGKTYKDGIGGSSLISSRDDACIINNYPLNSTYTDANGIVSIRAYTEEGIFNLSLLDSSLNLIVEEEEEEVVEEEDTSFNTIEELFIWLAGGNKVNRANSVNDTSSVCNLENFPISPASVFLSDWVKYTVPVVSHWYELIPIQGIICWIWDQDIKIRTIALVETYYSAFDYPFRVGRYGYTNAIPLTEEELLERFSEDC